ncbi:TonB-dependent hemin, ferrichrome receptor [hydrothermal vent metagenome]|uniref:TonB-dependent hemin, ferrichrome receptor n=1 Tax=hydrothermal vent metagenome TaxID=652676 RepID=A0A3B0UUL9_9ZZZZ
MRFKNNKCVALLGFLSVIFVTSAVAEDEEDVKRIELEKITVLAARTEKNTAELAMQVAVYTEEEMEQYSNRNIKDLVRYTPGVTVTGGGRFGLSGFNIRGIEGDRILTLIDGVPIADEFTFGPFLSARRNFVDLETLKAVEIVRGPTSSLYGSNALGGMVAFVSKDPKDYLGLTNDKSYYSYKLGFDSADESIHNSFTFATGNDILQGLLTLAHRQAAETKTFYTEEIDNFLPMGDVSNNFRRKANPQDITDLSLFGKLVFTPNEYNTFKFTMDRFESSSDGEALNQIGRIIFGSTRLDKSLFNDERDRTRLGFNFVSTKLFRFSDHTSLDVYVQNSKTTQQTIDSRFRLNTQVDTVRFRDSFFDQTNVGFKLQFVKNIETNINQQFIYGIDYDRNKSETLRNGRDINAIDGSIIPNPFTVFPTRDFPNSVYSSYGVFVQNEIELLDDKLAIIPGIRYDSFSLKPSVDEVYLSGNTGSPIPVDFEESEISAKLGLIYNFTNNLSLFAQYAEGFRAPPLGAVNIGFTNTLGGYTTLPNPDLRSESSRTHELGLRYRGTGNYYIEASIYKNTYDDFIESFAFLRFNPVTNLLEFQARNLEKAEISGFEIKGGIKLENWIDGLNFRYSYANSNGKDSVTKLPINTIQPESLVAGFSYEAPSNKWGAELIASFVARKDDIDDSGLQSTDPADPRVDTFEPPGYGIIDFIGRYNFTDKIRLNWGIFNLTDKKYWDWNNVGVQEPTSPWLNRFTETGRNASVTLKVEF